MDAEARKTFEQSLMGYPPVTLESAYDRLGEVLDDRVTLWRRGLANTFAKLSTPSSSHTIPTSSNDRGHPHQHLQQFRPTERSRV